jgi:hypothetical protein
MTVQLKKFNIQHSTSNIQMTGVRENLEVRR